MDRWRSPAEQWLTEPEPEPQIVKPIDCNSLTYLQSVYRDPSLPAGQRMRAAIECLPFENPRLSAVAIVPGGEDFPKRLERAVERSRQLKLIEHRSGSAPTIDHRSVTAEDR